MACLWAGQLMPITFVDEREGGGIGATESSSGKPSRHSILLPERWHSLGLPVKVYRTKCHDAFVYKCTLNCKTATDCCWSNGVSLPHRTIPHWWRLSERPRPVRLVERLCCTIWEHFDGEMIPLSSCIELNGMRQVPELTDWLAYIDSSCIARVALPSRQHHVKR